MKRLFFSIVSTIMMATGILSFLNAQETVSLRYSSGSTYYLVERSNWSKYINGTYTGLTHRETRANITATGTTTKGQMFSGFFYVLEETLRDMTATSRGIDAIQEASFTITPDGHMIFAKDTGYPSLREFPVYPETPVKPGDRWQAEGKRIIDPKNDGKKTVLPILVAYEFADAEQYHDKPVYRIRAKYATRLNKYLKTKTDDPDLDNATGTHDVDILVDSQSGAAILILDRLDETFFYKDGSSVRYKGNTALFTETPIAINKEALASKISGLAEKAADQTDRNGAKPSPDDQFSGMASGKPVEPEMAGNLPQGKTTRTSSLSEPASPVAPVVPKEIVPAAERKPPEGNAGGTKDAAPFTVEDTPKGLRLSVRDIRFQADSDNILPDEARRLDTIAETLRLVPGGRFLIEGHTASVGKPEGERQLSIARATKIADELSKRGLKAEQFMYAGYGGEKPIADNNTAKGRAQNRRVEITILE